jgi:hypothetical protein
MIEIIVTVVAIVVIVKLWKLFFSLIIFGGMCYAAFFIWVMVENNLGVFA